MICKNCGVMIAHKKEGKHFSRGRCARLLEVRNRLKPNGNSKNIQE